MALNAKLRRDGGFERQTKLITMSQTEKDDSERRIWEDMVALNARLKMDDSERFENEWWLWTPNCKEMMKGKYAPM